MAAGFDSSVVLDIFQESLCAVSSDIWLGRERLRYSTTSFAILAC